MMFDAHAERIDEYCNKNGFLTVRAVNKAPNCRPISH